MKFAWEEKLETKIREYLKGYPACHDYYHLDRVRKISLKIAEKETCDTEVLVAAALLHDVGYKGNEKNDLDHHVYSAEIAKNWLPEVGFPLDKISKVNECIRLHDNFPHMGEKFEKTDVVETLILQDADRTESLGAVGIVRTAYYCDERCKPIYSEEKIDDLKKPWTDHSFLEQIRRYTKDKWKDLNFDVSRQIAKKRHDFINSFYEELKEELLN